MNPNPVPPLTPRQFATFLTHIAIKDVDDCWLFTGDRDEQGYGLAYVGGERHRAHRVSYSIACGPIPDGLKILHSCDNPSCCNPLHLRPGTDQDNMNDMVARGHSTFGERANHVVLNASQVLEIRRMYQKHSQRFGTVALAKQFGVGVATVHCIVHRRTWKHI